MSKTLTLIYSDGNKRHKSDRMLSKKKLKEIFPDSETVSLGIQYQRKDIHKPHSKSESMHTHSKKSYIHNRTINLHGFNEKSGGL